MTPSPLLVLLPGMDGTGELFAPFVEALGPSTDTHVIRYPADPSLGYAELQAHVQAQLPGDRPYWLLGESFSGPVAIALAATRPAHLAGVILCCTFARCPVPRVPGLASLARLLPIKAAPAAWMHALLLGAHATPALREQLAGALRQVPEAALRARMLAVLEVDATPQLHRIDVPMLYLQGSEDRLVRKAAWRDVSQALPTAQCLSLPAPHMLLQASPAAAAHAVLAFVQQCRPRAATHHPTMEPT